MKKIISGLAVASLATFTFFGCSSEPRSIEEFQKMPKEELDKFRKECENKFNSADFQKELMQYATTGKSSNKEFIECQNANEAKIRNGMKEDFIPQGFKKNN